MKRKIFTILLVLGLLGMVLVPSASALTFGFDLISITKDVARSGLGDKPNWYQWLYRVDPLVGDGQNAGLSHFTIGLEECIQGKLAELVLGTAGANGVAPNSGNIAGLEGNEFRTYAASIGNDPTTGIHGIKWDHTSGGELKTVGVDYDYFWFSVPTNLTIVNPAAVKHGGAIARGTLLTPQCPDCKNPVVPEPTTLMLLGSGLVGVFIRKRRRS